MSLTYLMMYISSVLLVILYGSIGFSGAAPRSVSYDASPIYRKPRSTPETEVFSIQLNHLPEDRFVLRPLKRLIRAPAIVYTTGGPINAQDTTTTVQLPSSDPTSPISEIVSTSKEPKAPSSSERSGVNKRSADAQTSFFSPEKMRQTMVSMVSQRTANDAWSAASIDTSITSNDNGQELACNCTSGGEGILDPEDCDHSSGQCSCMSGYSGLQCEDCEDGHFTNGTSGCLPCSCDSFGAVNHLCDSSGMCLCKKGVYGPKCDDCHPGFFHFSSTGCQPCQCHNHTNYCHPQSGVCLSCMENTQGANCEECKPGFYRSSSATQEDPCSACPCSNTSSTGSCHTDAAGVPACDQCLPRYSGPRCEACAPGSFKVGGSCLPCECNGNEDPAGPAQLCDPASGRCLGCTNGTAGPQCQLCAPGFRGDARAHNCTRVPALRVLPTTENKTTTSPQPTSTAMAPPPAMPPADPTPTPTPSPTPTSNNNDTTTTAIGAPGATTPAAAPGENTTALTEVTWTQFNVVVLAVIILVVLLLLGFVGAVYAYREYQNRKLNAPFWTIELKEDNISFSSYHDSIPNADVSGLLEDEAGEAAPNGQLAFTTQGPCYKA